MLNQSISSWMAWAASAFLACECAPVLGQNRAGSDWKILFDGKTTAGWRGIGKTNFPEKGWVVEDGCLKHPKAGGGGDVITVDSYANFEFEWEWRLGAGANSGVKYLVVEKRGPIAHEYQMLDDAGKAVNKNSTGSLYDLLPPVNPPVKPVGEWNRSRIRVQGKQVEHWLNGVKVLEYELESGALNAAVAKSKFKSVAGFGAKVMGPILLQDHGGEAWFRNLRLRTLPAIGTVTGAVQSSKAGAWRSLFDGQDTSSWRGFKKPGFPTKGWVAEDGCLHVLPKGGGGDVITVEPFDNFEFSWEWKASYDCNSGVKYLIREERGAVGPEYQMLDDAHNAEGKNGPQRATASLYDVLGPTSVPLRPLAEFNESRILVQGNQVEHWLNGQKVLAYELGSPDLKAAVANSKFNNTSFFGIKTQGRILLQDHGHEVWFRNLKIRPLSEK